MAFNDSHGASVGDPAKKSFWDKILENTLILYDFIAGNGAKGTGTTGHNHTGSGMGVVLGTGAVSASAAFVAGVVNQAAIGASAVGQGELKSSTQEVSTAATANLALSSASSYGFWPQIKKSTGSINAQMANNVSPGTSYVTYIYLDANGAGTAYAQVRYIQASRDLPVFWLLRDRKTGAVISSVFDPEANGARHPFADYAQGKLPKDLKVECWIPRDKKTREHFFRGRGAGHWFLDQIHMGLFFDALDSATTISPVEHDFNGECDFISFAVEK